MEDRIQPSLNVSFHRPLGNAVRDGRDPEHSSLAVALRNSLLTHRWWKVRPRTQTVPDLVEIAIPLSIKVRQRLTITARRSAVLSDVVVRRPHQRFRHLEWFSLRQGVILNRVVQWRNESDADPFAPGPLQALQRYYEPVRPYLSGTC